MKRIDASEESIERFYIQLNVIADIEGRARSTAGLHVWTTLSLLATTTRPDM